jgi:hypothetical protein
VGFLTNKDVDARRQQAGFKRSYDGRVSVQHKMTKEWLDVKVDLQVGCRRWLPALVARAWRAGHRCGLGAAAPGAEQRAGRAGP